MNVNRVFGKCRVLFLFIIWCTHISLSAENSNALKNDTVESRNSTAGTTETESPATVYTTEVMPGIYHGVYSKEESPVLIKGNVAVPAGKLLEFGPGCTVYISPGAKITVYGELRALGTRKEPVKFISSSQNPSGGDWNSIHIRSRSVSLFRNSIIRHAESGLKVENSSVSVKGCIFERNNHGLSIRSSEVTLFNSVVRNGHHIALFVQQNAVLKAQNILLRDNATAVLLSDRSDISIDSSSISHNEYGFVVPSGAGISMEKVKIRKNRYGIFSAADLPLTIRKQARKNADNFKKASKEKIHNLFSSDSTIVTSIFSPVSNQSSMLDQSDSKKNATSFIGNVTAGFSYHRPRSYKHPIKNRNVTYTTVPVSDDSSRADSTVVYKDTLIYQKRYPGEQSDRFYAGLKPEIQLFASGKRGKTDINLLMDMHGSQWMRQNNYIRKNLFNLSMDYDDKALVFGDFYESGSEISMAGRQMTGIRFTGDFWEKESGDGLVEVRLAAGETEMAQDVGDRHLDIYNEVVDSGMSVRQQITYVLSGLIRPNGNSHFSARGIISRDQIYKPLFGSPINDKGAPEPLQAQTGLFEGGIMLFGGAMELFAELDLGNHDTIPKDEWENTAWYNPEIEEAVPKVLSLLNRKDFRSHSAVLGGVKGFHKDLKLQFTVMEIADRFFSAGNPYLENDKRRITLGAEKILIKKIDASAEYEYEKVLMTQNPETRNSAHISAVCKIGEYLPELSLDYITQLSTSDKTERVAVEGLYYDSAYTALDMQNLLSMEGRQTFKNGTSYSLRYQILHDNDLADHPDSLQNNLEDGIQHQLSGSLKMRYRSLFRNRFSFRVATKETKRDSLRGLDYRLRNRFTYTVLPRRLSMSIAGDYSRRRDKEFCTDQNSWEDPVLTVAYGGESEIRYTINSKYTLSCKGRYEKSYDELPGSSENYTLLMGAFHVTCLF